MTTRNAGDFIVKYTCIGCGFEAHGWYSDIWQQHQDIHPTPPDDDDPSDAGSAPLAFLLALTTLAVAWFAVDDVPGVVGAMGLGVLRIAGYAVVGCVVAWFAWPWVREAIR